jgi:hypothetical protein
VWQIFGLPSRFGFPLVHQPQNPLEAAVSNGLTIDLWGSVPGPSWIGGRNHQESQPPRQDHSDTTLRWEKMEKFGTAVHSILLKIMLRK